MSPDQQPSRAESTPIEIGPVTPVIEFGGAEPAGKPRGRRFSAAARAQALVADRRLVPLAAVLGAVALFASLISEWQVTDVDAIILGAGEVGTKPLATSLGDLGAWGAGYLVGVFVLVATTVLVLFGPAPGRRYAWLVGLSAGGVLAGLLAAIGSELGDSSHELGKSFAADLTAQQVQISYGRGLWCAVFGVAAVLVALVLAGRHLLPPEEPVAAATEPEATTAMPPVWSWRRPRAASGDEDERRPDEPFDLTVSSAKPFTASADERDKGISG